MLEKPFKFFNLAEQSGKGDSARHLTRLGYVSLNHVPNSCNKQVVFTQTKCTREGNQGLLALTITKSLPHMPLANGIGVF